MPRRSRDKSGSPPRERAHSPAGRRSGRAPAARTTAPPGVPGAPRVPGVPGAPRVPGAPWGLPPSFRVFDRFAIRALLLTGILLLASGLTFDPKLYINGDNVDYMLLARRLLDEGEWWASRKLPPFFPMMLAPVQLLFGAGWLAQKLLVFALYLASGPLLLGLAERVLPRGWAFASALVALLAVPVLEFSHYVMSEIPFLFLSLLALRMGERTPRSIVLFFLFSALAFYTRSVGAALPVAFLLVSAAQRSPRPLLWGAALSALTLVPWLLHSYAAGLEGQTYLDQVIYINPYYPDWGKLDAHWLLHRLGENSRRYFLQDIPSALLPLRYFSTYTPGAKTPLSPAAIALAVPVMGVAAFGAVRCARRLPLTVAYVGVFAGTAVCWPPIWTSTRFVLPVLPLLAVFLIAGLRELPAALARRRGRRWPALVPAALVALLLILAARNVVAYGIETRRYPPVWEYYFKGAAWAKEHLPSASLVLDRKPNMFTLVSGLPAVSFPRESDPERMLAYLRERGVRYVHASSIPYDDLPRILYPFLRQRDRYFNVVWSESASQGAWSALLEFRSDGDGEGFRLDWSRSP